MLPLGIGDQTQDQPMYSRMLNESCSHCDLAVMNQAHLSLCMVWVTYSNIWIIFSHTLTCLVAMTPSNHMTWAFRWPFHFVYKNTELWPLHLHYKKSINCWNPLNVINCSCYSIFTLSPNVQEHIFFTHPVFTGDFSVRKCCGYCMQIIKYLDHHRTN